MPKVLDSHEPQTRTRRTKDGKRKKKDPNAPKRAMSSYMHFANSERPKILKEQENLPDEQKLSFGAIGKELGIRWKGLNADDKKIYEDAASRDRERYQQEMEVYHSSFQQ